ncbi:MAG: hypothetical protein ACREDR_45165, partial [Blastocatellia bacterium]
HIELIESDRKKHRIIVPDGMMADIVRPLWECQVEVIGTISKGVIYLDDINPVKQESQAEEIDE